MEPIYAPNFGERTRKRKLKIALKRDQLWNDILNDVIKFLCIATFLNIMYHSDKVLKLIGL